MVVTVTLKMDEDYPDISSGIVSFENARTGTKVNIKAPEDFKNSIYGIQSITMDTGAGCTILPEKFAQIIDIEKPTGNMRRYQIFSGVGGTSVCFISSDLIMIGIEDEKGNRIEKITMPFVLVKYSPSVTSEGQLLSEFEQYHAEHIIDFISPLFQYRDNYTMEIHSPDEIFPLLDRRLRLEVDVGEMMDYILIGRDWQKVFKLTFESETLYIKAENI